MAFEDYTNYMIEKCAQPTQLSFIQYLKQAKECSIATDGKVKSYVQTLLFGLAATATCVVAVPGYFVQGVGRAVLAIVTYDLLELKKAGSEIFVSTCQAGVLSVYTLVIVVHGLIKPSQSYNFTETLKKIDLEAKKIEDMVKQELTEETLIKLGREKIKLELRKEIEQQIASEFTEERIALIIEQYKAQGAVEFATELATDVKQIQAKNKELENLKKSQVVGNSPLKQIVDGPSVRIEAPNIDSINTKKEFKAPVIGQGPPPPPFVLLEKIEVKKPEWERVKSSLDPKAVEASKKKLKELQEKNGKTTSTNFSMQKVESDVSNVGDLADEVVRRAKERQARQNPIVVEEKKEFKHEPDSLFGQIQNKFKRVNQEDSPVVQQPKVQQKVEKTPPLLKVVSLSKSEQQYHTPVQTKKDTEAKTLPVKGPNLPDKPKLPTKK